MEKAINHIETKVGTVLKGDLFIHNNILYKVKNKDYTFVKAVKLNYDGYTHYFVRDINVLEIIENFQH